MAEHSRVLFRVDAGHGIGFGHVTRCLALARHLIASGAAVTFATRARTPEILRRIESWGVSVKLLPAAADSERADGPVWSAEVQRADAEATVMASENAWDAVVVDHYRLDATWEDAARENARRVVAIDDLANRAHTSDVLVDHNWYGDHNAKRYIDLVPRSTVQLLGPRYAMLHPEYSEARRQKSPVSFPPKRLLVSFGGTDVGRQTQTAVEGILDVPDIRVDAALGAAGVLTPELEQLGESPRVALHVGLPSLVGLLREADLVIGAGGTATWERLCMGVPAIVTTVSDNQSGVTRAFHNAQMTRWLGTSSAVKAEDYRRAVSEFIGAPQTEVLPIVDGHGAGRIALAVLPPSTVEVASRGAELLDAPSVVTAGVRGNEGPEHWRASTDAFRARYGNGDIDTVLEVDGIPVGIRSAEHGDSDWLEPFLHAGAKPEEAQR